MQRKRMSLSRTTLATFAIFSGAVAGFAQSPDPAPAPQIDMQPGTVLKPEPPDFTSGLKAMDEARWADALKSFDKVAAAHGDYADAALYWKAYNLEKLGRKEDSRAACAQLSSTKPQSPWNNECVALRVESGADPARIKADVARVQANEIRVSADQIRKNAEAMRDAQRAQRDAIRELTREWGDEDGSRGRGEQTPHDPNDDLRLLALNSLMQQEPEKAMPLLRTFILSDKPIELRRRALFVLGESKAPGAPELLMEVASKSTDPQLQRAAVQTLATTRGKDAAPTLVKIYQASSDHEVKRAAVSGLFIARDATDLVELSRAEKDMDMKRDIVTQLALMHDPAATAYMEELLK